MGQLFTWIMIIGFLYFVYNFFNNRNKGESRNTVSVSELPAGFKATYSAKNIALDVENRKVWVRDMSGETAVLDTSEIKSWDHKWVDVSVHGRIQKTDNVIEIKTSSLQKPVWRVSFKIHTGVVLYSEKDWEIANEWFGRLSAFMNS